MIWVKTAQWALGMREAKGLAANANPPSWRTRYSRDGSASKTVQHLAEPKMKPGPQLDLAVLCTWSWVPPSLQRWSQGDWRGRSLVGCEGVCTEHASVKALES